MKCCCLTPGLQRDRQHGKQWTAVTAGQQLLQRRFTTALGRREKPVRLWAMVTLHGAGWMHSQLREAVRCLHVSPTLRLRLLLAR